jgi:hypothetical protein
MRMDTSEIIIQIAEKDFDLDAFVHLAILNESARKEIIRQMFTNPAIMVYYHCYYIVEKASRKSPKLFYPYWSQIAALLHHENSYHRDFALEIIANLTAIDAPDQFSQIKSEYFSHIRDPKFMTGNCCVKNLQKIFQHKPALREEICEMLLTIDTRTAYTEKQKSLLKADVLRILDEIYADSFHPNKINDFIKTEVSSISPKTRKLARELLKKYSL